MTIQPGAVLNTQGFGNRPENIEIPVIETRNPTTGDVNYPIGKRWVNRLANSEYTLTSQSTLGGVLTSTWTSGSGASGLTQLTGNSGVAVQSGGNINVLGTGAINVTGAGSTLTISTSADTLFPITPYVVGPMGFADYQTIQAAVNAANAAGGGAVWIQPGSYTENLTLYPDVTLSGATSLGIVQISGVHVPPTSGICSFQNISLQSATHILDNSSAGSPTIVFEYCIFNLTSGFIVHCQSFTGQIVFLGCIDGGSSENGIILNTSGANVLIANSTLGAPGGLIMYNSGETNIIASNINCSYILEGTSENQWSSTNFQEPVAINNSAQVTAFGCYFNGNSSEAINYNSSANSSVQTSTVASNGGLAINGSGSGFITLTNVAFPYTHAINSSVNLNTGEIRGGNFITQYVVGAAPDAFYQSVQSAVNASVAAGVNTVWVQPGTYVENISFPLDSTVAICGCAVDGENALVTIQGTHTVSSAGNITFANINLTSATDVITSAAAGTAGLFLDGCTGGSTDGYFINLPNWTGAINVFNCAIDNGTNDGFCNLSSGTSMVTLFNSVVGAGTSHSFTNGGGIIEALDSFINCPVLSSNDFLITKCVFNGAVDLSAGNFSAQNSVFTSLITTTGSAQTGFEFCNFSTGAAPMMNNGSSANQVFNNCSTSSTATDIIFGTGTGNVSYSNLECSDGQIITGSFTIIPEGAILGNDITYVGNSILASDSGADATIGNISGAAATTIKGGTGGVNILTPAGQVSMFPGTITSATDSATLNSRYGSVIFTGQTTSPTDSQTLSITNSNFGADKAVLATIYNLNASGLGAAVTLTAQRLTGTVMDFIYTNNGMGALSTGDDVIVTFWVTN